MTFHKNVLTIVFNYRGLINLYSVVSCVRSTCIGVIELHRNRTWVCGLV